MSEQAYIVATLARGTASLGFTYLGREGLQPGTLVGISLRGSLEIGLVLGEDPQPPEHARLLHLVELAHHWKRIGPLLLKLAELSCSGVHEVAGHLLLDNVGSALRLELAVPAPELLAEQERSGIGRLSGKLGSGRAKTLIRENGWKRICELAEAGGIRMLLRFAGTPEVTRSDPRLRRWYKAGLPMKLLPSDGYLPGNYLNGFGDAFDHRAWLHREQKQERWQFAEPGEPKAWQEAEWPEGWQLLADIPGLAGNGLEHRSCRLSELAELLQQQVLQAVAADQRLLVILPQLWMQQHCWPALQAAAPRVHWYGSDSGISTASHILARLQDSGQAVFGGPSAWKLAAWSGFDRVLLVDPSHPQFANEREPHLDYREALLACISGSGCRLQLLEMGLSLLDGSSGLGSMRIEKPRGSDEAAELHDGSIDSDPLPLQLRQPGIRRLVYFNRLGSSRGLRCVDCGSLVDCPECGSRRIHFSQGSKAYVCPDCSFTNPRLRCQKCGLATLSSQLPGLEALQRRDGDVVVQANAAPPEIGEGTQSVFGTSQLLEPPAGFRPEQVVYVQADNPVGYIENWPQELDMLARLDALYEPTAADGVWMVSDRLADLLGGKLDGSGLARRYGEEMGLRRLALLPPFGTVLRLRLFTKDFSTAQRLRTSLGDELKAHPATTVLRLGQPVAVSGSVRLSGYIVNEELGYQELQQLRWRLFSDGGTLSLQPLRGPWP